MLQIPAPALPLRFPALELRDLQLLPADASEPDAAVAAGGVAAVPARDAADVREVEPVAPAQHAERTRSRTCRVSHSPTPLLSAADTRSRSSHYCPLSYTQLRKPCNTVSAPPSGSSRCTTSPSHTMRLSEPGGLSPCPICRVARRQSVSASRRTALTASDRRCHSTALRRI